MMAFIRSLPAAFSRYNLLDLIDTHNHSRDFRAVRADYFTTRTRLMALVFAVLAGLWLAIDRFFLDPAYFQPIAWLHGGVSVLYAWLGLRVIRRHDLRAAHAYLVAFVGFAALFYIAARQVMPHAEQTQAMLVGYYFLPFLLVSMMALFPMTLAESVGYLLGIGSLYLAHEWWLGDLADIVTVGNAWLLGMMALMALWAQLSQLHMLLRLYREATHDVLTGLTNRRALMNVLTHEVETARQARQPLSVLLMDLDHFKRINDTYGHIVGDEVLRQFGGLLAQAVRAPHLAARFGGEEFFAVLPGMAKDAAAVLAETLRARCHDLAVRSEEGEPLRVTVSIGVAELQDGEEISRLISRVDEVLYQAKESGRDLVSAG